MRTALFYRYFVGIRPPPYLYPSFQRIGTALGLRLRLDLLHLTLCVVAQSLERDPFIARRIGSVLDDQPPVSFAVNLSRVKAGPNGAFARSFGPQPEIQELYTQLVGLLGRCGIAPLYRKSGLHPHVTLTHDAGARAEFGIALSWVPTELLLIESEWGLGKHNVLRRWPLLPPSQGVLPFDDADQVAIVASRKRFTPAG